MFKLTTKEKSWILYDVGNSAFILLVSTIIPIYFDYIASKEQISSVTYLAYWGYATSIATILVAVLGPFMGAHGDYKDKKLKCFLSTVVIGVIALMAMGCIQSWLAFLFVFIIAKVAYSISLIHYDSMLMDVTSEENLDRVSTYGFAYGYIGSCIPFVIGLLLVLGYKSIGISFQVAIILAFIINGLWWFVCTVPLLKNYKQVNYIEKDKERGSKVDQIVTLFKEIKSEKHIMLFLVSFFFYIDGVFTVMNMATVYGKSMGLDSTGMLLALLTTQLVAFPCSILFGRIVQKIQAEKLITVCIVAYFLIAIFAIFLDSQVKFWILAILVGMFQGTIQALSRSYYAKIIPKEKSGEYYGVLDVCGKGASFVGVFLISVISQITNSTAKGVSVVSVIILIGLIFFRLSVREYQKSSFFEESIYQK